VNIAGSIPDLYHYPRMLAARCRKQGAILCLTEMTAKEKGLTISRQPLLYLVAPAGLEPATKRL